MTDAMNEWALPTWSPTAPMEIAAFTLESWPITTAVTGVTGLFDNEDDFRRRALARIERRMRVYEVPHYPHLRIALPEDYALALDSIRRIRTFLNGASVDGVPADSVVDASLLQRALPEDIVSLLQLAPPTSVVDAIILLDEPNPADAWFRQSSGNAEFISAASASNGVITLYRAERHAELRDYLFHEVAHLLGEWSELDMHWFAIAANVEAGGYMHRDRAAANLAENWAVHLGECVLGEDSEPFVRFCHEAPLRAATLGHLLSRFFEEGHDRWNEPAAERRAVHLSAVVRARAMEVLRIQLAECDYDDPRDTRLHLLLALASGAPLFGFEARTQLDLSNSLLTSRALASLADFSSLAELDLSGTLIGRGGLEKLPALPRLRHLDLHGMKLFSSDMRRLEALPSLDWLDVSGTQINVSSLPTFTRLRALRFLRISCTEIAGSASNLRDALPWCVVEA